ncbi:MAG TPA: Lsr2 family protein [Propionicimonas sp.]
MARTYVAVIRDDLTGEVVDPGDAESIEFAVNGKSYTIDLGKKNAAEFHKSLDKYIAVATKVGGAGTRKPARASKEDLTAIREWGKENGFTVSARGRVSSELKNAYRKAH